MSNDAELISNPYVSQLVAADGSWRCLHCEMNAPTAVGGYALSVDGEKCEISRTAPVP